MTSRGYTSEEGNRISNLAVEPKIYVDSTPNIGFTQYAEILNGRLAMIGFVSLLAIEVISKHGLVSWFINL